MSQVIAEWPARPTGPALRPAPLPPGPRRSTLGQSLSVARDPAGFLIRCREQYGDCFRNSFLNVPRIAYVARPDLVKAAFDTDKGGGLAGAARAKFMEPLVGRHSLLTLDGPEWLRQRRLLGPPFHGRAIAAYRDQIAEIAAAAVERWPTDTVIRLRPRMEAITLEVILRVVFGIQDSERLARLRDLLPRMISAGVWIGLLPGRAWRGLERIDGVPGLSRANPYSRLVAIRDEVDELIYAEIAERRASPNGSARTDVLSVLLAARDEEGREMSDVELRDELVTMLEAGHDTTATGLAWVFERLLRHPRELALVERGLAEGDEAYLEAAIRECLRVRPVVVDTARVLTEPLEVGGFRVPTGWWIATAIPAVHAHPGVWSEPNRFRPERFLGDPVPPHAWIPFGGGQRRCVGSRLAMLEIQTTVVEVLRRLRLRASDARPEPGRLNHVTMVPARQCEVIAAPRRRSRER